MALEAFLDAMGPAAAPIVPRGTSGLDAQREADRRRIIQGEMDNATDPETKAGLARELGRLPGQPAANDAGPLSGALRALSEETPEAPTAAPKTASRAPAGQNYGGGVPPIEAGLHWLTGGIGTAVGGWRSLLGNALGEEGATEAGQKLAQDMTYDPRTVGGKRIVEIPGQVAGKVISAADRWGATHGAPEAGSNVAHASTKIGDFGYEVGSKIDRAIGSGVPAAAPLLGAIGATAPAAVATALGLGGKAGAAGELTVADRTAAAANGNARVRGPAAPVESAMDRGRGTESGPGPTERPVLGGGAAVANANPYPVFRDEEAARGAFPVVKLSKSPTNVPASEQAARAKVVTEIGLDRARTGVITGNEDTLRSEHALAKAADTSPEGAVLKQQIAGEQKALSDYAEKRVTATGAMSQLTDDYARGQFLHAGMAGEEGIKDFITQQKRAIYDEARAKTGDNPVAAANIESLTNSPQFKAELKVRGLKDFTDGLNDLIDVHRTTGFEGAAPNSIASMEKLRQSLNAQWTPQNKWAIGRAIEAIDNDAALAGGPGLYERGRAIHAAEKQLYGSKGISTIFGDLDANGIQLGTDFEKIPQKLNALPQDQWNHIYETVNSVANGHIPGMPMLEVPEHLRFVAEKMRAEMAGSLAREVHQAGAANVGTWNSNAANKIMNARARKISIAMPPEEQAAFHTLNYGGQIMPGAHSYEGAAQQARRLGTLESKLPVIGAVAGETIGSVLGAPGIGTAAGHLVGEKLQGMSSSRRMLNAARKQDAQMESNAKLGKQ